MKISKYLFGSFITLVIFVITTVTFFLSDSIVISMFSIIPFFLTIISIMVFIAALETDFRNYCNICEKTFGFRETISMKQKLFDLDMLNTFFLTLFHSVGLRPISGQ